MSQGAENKGQDFHLGFLQLGRGAPAWQRKGADVISCHYQTGPEMKVEEEFNTGKLEKNTYYHDLKSGKIAKVPEPFDYSIGGQITVANARNMLAVFDRIDTQISTGMRLSQMPADAQQPAFRIMAEDGFGFSVYMLQSENEMNRIRQIRPQVALVETHDMANGAVKASLIDTATGRSRPTNTGEIELMMAGTTSPAVIPPQILSALYGDLSSEHAAKQPAVANVQAKAETEERITPVAAAREMLERFNHPKDAPAAKPAPTDHDPRPHNTPRKRPGPGR